MITITSFEDMTWNEKHEITEKLYNDSALTLEGLCLDDIDEYIEYLKKECGLNNDSPEVYVISGHDMNMLYDSDYPQDLNIVCMFLSNFEDVCKLALKRFAFGGRWFDDVVDNWQRREAL